MPMPLPHVELNDPRVLALARWRQQLSHEGVFNPTWEELTDQEREDSLPDARNYLKAAIRAGLIPDAAEPAPQGAEPATMPTVADVESLHAFLYARADDEYAATFHDPLGGDPTEDEVEEDILDPVALGRFSRVSNSNKHAITATAELLVDLLNSRGDSERIARAWHLLTGAGEQWRDHPDYLPVWQNPQLAAIRQALEG